MPSRSLQHTAANSTNSPSLKGSTARWRLLCLNHSSLLKPHCLRGQSRPTTFRLTPCVVSLHNIHVDSSWHGSFRRLL
jgi:hypothetical protein